jgi:hypothetical protein
MISVALFALCFLATLGIGFLDTHRHNKANRDSERSGNGRA